MNTYELVQEIQALETYIDKHAEENIGVVPEEALKQLNNYEADLNAKIEGIYKVIKNKQAIIDSIQEQKRNFDRRLKTLNRSVEFLKSLATFALDGQKFEYGIAKFSYRKSKQLVINDEDNVPDTFINYERKINKVDLKDYIQSGGEVEGVEVKEFNNLVVK